MSERRSKETVQSVENALKLLECFIYTEEMGVTEIANMMGIGKATASRLVFSLQKYGYLQKDELTQKYRLGMKLMRLGFLVKERNELVYVAEPYMKELAYRYQLCAHLVVMDGYQVKFIHKILAGSFISMRSSIGGGLPAYGTATGKCLLAYSTPEEVDVFFRNVQLLPMTQETIIEERLLRKQLKIIQECGYAEDKGESDVGLYCIAIPIKDSSGHVIAAMSLSGLKETVVGSKWKIIEKLTEASCQIGQKI